MKLDAIDKRILGALQRNGRMQNTELAQEVGLSASPCLRRVKLLEDEGIIDRYVALLKPSKIGMRLPIFVRVTLDRQDKDTVEHFAAEVARLPEVMECHLMSGNYDYLLRVVTADLDEYQRFQMEYLTTIRGVRYVQTEIPLKQIKQTTVFPL